MLNIVLHEPEMPANTGNIGRTCVATDTVLHLIEPLGFKINDKMLKRAGLDYWDKLDVRIYDDFDDFLAKNPGAKLHLAHSSPLANPRSTQLLGTGTPGPLTGRTDIPSGRRLP